MREFDSFISVGLTFATHTPTQLAEEIIQQQKQDNLFYEVEMLEEAGSFALAQDHFVNNCGLVDMTPEEALAAFHDGHEDLAKEIFGEEGAVKIMKAKRLGQEIDNWHNAQKAGERAAEVLSSGLVVWEAA